MPITGKELIRELLGAGFAVKRVSGSHFVLERDEVVVPCHDSDLNGNKKEDRSLSMKGYPARFEREQDGRYSVYFLGEGMDGYVTYGNDSEDARRNAREALNAYIGYLYSAKKMIPVPSDYEGKDIECFSPDCKIEFAIILRKEREKAHLTQNDMAKRLGILNSQYQRLENPYKTNPTLETMHRIESALGRSIFLRF